MKKKDISTHRKKVGIYDRWLHTLGGGEQVAFAYAQTFRDCGYDVEILTHKKFNLSLAEKKMKVDLRGVEIRYIPSLLDYQLSEYTQNYDVFVCNSYLDYIPNRSKFGILSVFFPSRIKLSVFEYLKRAHIVPSLRRFFIYPSQFEGFRYDEFVHGQIYKWLGKESTIYFNKHVSTVQLALKIEYLAFSCIDQIEFFLGDKKIEPHSRRINKNTNTLFYEFQFGAETKPIGLTIRLPESEYSQGVALTSVSIRHYQYFFYNLFKSLFPSWEMRLHGGPSVTKFSDINSYDSIVAISQFTRRWIKNYWGLESNVIYPPVNTKEFAGETKKRNVIVNVGRFFVGGHSKKQLDMLRVFKRMVDSGIKDWELHFIGSVESGFQHRLYLETIREEAKGYPVFLHIDAPFAELRKIVQEAKIYWHATGLDENVQRYPIRLEHFGITTVEAMAAGCVPIVIDCGGQTEIVTKGTGRLWKTREQLLQYTIELIQHPELLEQYRKAATQRSQDFSENVFRQELEKLLRKYGVWG
jgi:glycosyltransferase involved in cell wall biosynthesis